MIAEVDVMEPLATAEITGPAAASVVKLLFADVLDKLDPLADTTSKSYVVPGVNPVNVTE